MVNQMDKMIPHKYGKFKECQVDYYKDKLRKKIYFNSTIFFLAYLYKKTLWNSVSNWGIEISPKLSDK